METMRIPPPVINKREGHICYKFGGLNHFSRDYRSLSGKQVRINDYKEPSGAIAVVSWPNIAQLFERRIRAQGIVTTLAPLPSDIECIIICSWRPDRGRAVFSTRRHGMFPINN